MATTSVLTSDRPPIEPSSQIETFRYDNSIVRLFLIATTVWGIIGMTVGLLVALQFVYPALSFDLPFLTFGRISTAAHQRSNFCLRGQRYFRRSVLFAPATLQNPDVQRYAE